MSKVLIGCPVRKRAWILAEWHRYARESAEKAGVETEFLVLIPSYDEETLKVCKELEIEHIRITEEEDFDGDRLWNRDRYFHMVALRNNLLQEVRKIEPDFFLSLDSDILLHPDCLGNMLESTARFDAVGGRAYMTDIGKWCVSWANVTGGGGLIRDDYDDVRAVGAIMAIKLMSRKAYNIDYAEHIMGEDIGWSLNCRGSVKIGVDGRVVNKHVMKPEQLHEIDKRCGY